MRLARVNGSAAWVVTVINEATAAKETPMKTIALFAVLATACSPAFSSAPAVQTVASPIAPFGEYRAFSFGFTENPPALFEASARSLEVEHRVRDLLGVALREKGYVEDDTRPSFVVRFGTGTRQEEESRVYEDVARGPSDVFSFGQIKVDIFDASTRTEVWRGTAVSRVDLTKGIDDGLLQRAVEGVLASFPTRRGTDVRAVAAPIAAGGAL